MKKHIICIHEVQATSGNIQHCQVKVSIDGKPLPGVRQIKDPFAETITHHSYVTWYLEDRLSDEPCDQKQADKHEAHIHQYRTELFKSLELRDEINYFTHSTVEINIFAYERANELVGPSLHTSILDFYFELLELVPLNHEGNGHASRRRQHRSLEHTNIWPLKISKVLVQRVILNKPFSNDNLSFRNIPRVVPWSEFATLDNSSSASTFSTSIRPTKCRVLLVIARKLERPGKEISPSYIEYALLRLFENLNRAIRRRFYQLEVVRPGSFAELKAHLAAAKNDPFQIVHFDLHGFVLCQKVGCGLPRRLWRSDAKERSCRERSGGHFGQAYLLFARTDESGHLVTSKHSAEEVASLLYENNVHCVALNACESARTNEGDAGNLSYTFLRQGISNVVAMSFRISDVIFVKYYRSFYEKLFEPNSNFSLAASHARLELRRDRERRNAKNDVIYMDDWFVPVVYCNEKIVQMPIPEQIDGAIMLADDFENARSRQLRLAKLAVAFKVVTVFAIICFLAFLLYTYRDEHWMLFFSLVISSSGLLAIWFLLKAFIAMLSFRCMRYPAVRELKIEMLNNSMLIIENELKNHRTLLLRGLTDTPDTLSLLDNLSYVWVRTNFIDLAVVIPSAWFYQPASIQMLRHWCCCLVHGTHCCAGDKLPEKHIHPPEKIMVIVTDLELLFPQDPRQMKLGSSARQRFVRVLEQYFKDEEASTEAEGLDVSSGGGKPYLFLSGNDELQTPGTFESSMKELKVSGIESTFFSEVGKHNDRDEQIKADIDRR